MLQRPLVIGSTWTLLILPLLVVHCTFLGTDTDRDELAERTYPEAYSFPAISIATLSQPGLNPGLYNVNAYVTEISICPPNVRCFLPDGITLAPRLNPGPSDTTYYLSMLQPGQMQIRGRYALSLEVTDAGYIHPIHNYPVVFITLKGYSIA